MNLFGTGGSGPEPEPDIVVSRTVNGWWRARGRGARESDRADTLAKLFEILTHGNRRGVVEVHQDGRTWTTTIEELRRDYSKEYPGPRRVPDNDKPDPFYDFL